MKGIEVSGIMLTLLLIGMLTLAFSVQFARAEPRTWTVDDDGPADFSKIQSAINAASSGDTIFVHDGVYYEHLTISESISLVGEDRNASIIDGSRNGTVISVIADYVNVSGFTIQNGYYVPHITYGIKIGEWSHGCKNVAVYDNIISANDVGVFLYYSNNVTVSNNILLSNFQGLSMAVSGDNQIEGNSFVSNEEGISVGGYANSNLIIDNDISNSDFGIIVGWSNGNNIVGNEISLSISAGIRFDSSSSSRIIGNTITSSSRDGIVLFGSDNNTIIMNELIENNWDGIAVWYSKANLIYHNNFQTNTKQAGSYSGSTNAWDDGYPSGGNYWNNYAGVDLNSGANQDVQGSDGVGDVPYVIDANNRDRYPLMNPWAPTPAIAMATIRVDPETLNLRSKANWITAYVQLPEGYDAADIDASTILLNGTITPVLDPSYGFVANSSEYLVDFNNDGILERIVKFDRVVIGSFIASQGISNGDAALTITGKLRNGTQFEGTGIIFVTQRSAESLLGIKLKTIMIFAKWAWWPNNVLPNRFHRF